MQRACLNLPCMGSRFFSHFFCLFVQLIFLQWTSSIFACMHFEGIVRIETSPRCTLAVGHTGFCNIAKNRGAMMNPVVSSTLPWFDIQIFPGWHWEKPQGNVSYNVSPLPLGGVLVLNHPNLWAVVSAGSYWWWWKSLILVVDANSMHFTGSIDVQRRSGAACNNSGGNSISVAHPFAINYCTTSNFLNLRGLFNSSTCSFETEGTFFF